MSDNYGPVYDRPVAASLNTPQVKRSATDSLIMEMHAQLNKASSIREMLDHMTQRLMGHDRGNEVAGKSPNVPENAPFLIRADDVIKRLDYTLSESMQLVQNLSQL